MVIVKTKFSVLKLSLMLTGAEIRTGSGEGRRKMNVRVGYDSTNSSSSKGLVSAWCRVTILSMMASTSFHRAILSL